MLTIHINEEGVGDCTFTEKKDAKGFFVAFEDDPTETFMSDKALLSEIRFQIRRRRKKSTNGRNGGEAPGA